MIRICSVDIYEKNNDIKILHNIKSKALENVNFSVVGIMLSEKNNENISNQLKEFNTYYYDNNTQFEKYIKRNKIKNIIIGINLDNINSERDVKSFIKSIRKIGQVCRKINVQIGINEKINNESNNSNKNNEDNKNKIDNEDINDGEVISCIIFNYRDKLNIKDYEVKDLIDSIKIEMYDTKKERYNYIYDKTYDMLNYEFTVKNLCQFKDNKCIEKRRTNVICGCCRRYKNIFSKKLVKCRYLKNKKCVAKCISCKLFTCDTLKKKNIKYGIKNFYLLNNYFNFIQKLIIKYSVYTPKDKIMKRLLILGK